MKGWIYYTNGGAPEMLNLEHALWVRFLEGEDRAVLEIGYPHGSTRIILSDKDRAKAAFVQLIYKLEAVSFQ